MPHHTRVETTRRVIWRGVLLLAFSLFALPAAACTSCGAAFSIAANTATQVAQIGLMTSSMLAAIGAHGGGAGQSTNGPTMASADAAKSNAEAETAVAMRETFHKVRASNTIGMQSTNCRIGTKNLLAPAMDNIASTVKQLQERGIVGGMFFNSVMTPQRIATGHIYRLCKNGQLTRNDFGDAWFNTNQCIEDPMTAHDYLQASTILDYPVLIPPPQATLDILNNPEASTAPAITAAWSGLNDKQKKYIGATRFCENLVLSRIRPQEIRGDAATSSTNMAIVAQNLSAMASLSSVRDMCLSELSRRTAIDPATMPAGAHRTAIEQNAEKVINFLVNMRGADPKELYAYSSLANYNANNPIQVAGNPKAWVSQYVIDRHPRDFGLSIKCVGYGDGGTDAERTANGLACAQTAQIWENNESQRRKNFLEAVASVRSAPAFSQGVAAPTRAGYVPGVSPTPLLRDAALDIPGLDQKTMPLRDMIQAMDAVAQPTRNAAVQAPTQP